MGKWRVTKRIEFDAAHRLCNYVGKCSNVHGHRYAAEFTFSSDRLTDQGFVVDFGDIKRLIGNWIDEYWDHALILKEGDEAVNISLSDAKVYYMDKSNPTAENMAEYLWNKAFELFDKESIIDYTREHEYRIRLEKVRVYETPTSWAEYMR